MTEYNDDFIFRMKQILKDDFAKFFSSLQSDAVKGLYVNESKISVEDFKNLVDFPISPIGYEKAGFYIDTDKKGRHPLHHAGAFYLQEPSAMFTVNSHKFRGDEYVLDLCAAPGGKTIQIANRIPCGLIVSNEIDFSRSKILFSNVERMGLKNVIVTNDTTEKVAKAYANCFDVCLVDAPCSGEGMLRKGHEVIENVKNNSIEKCAIRQLEILEDANIALKNGGYLIYSTCTYNLEENENVVRKFLSKHNYELVPIDCPQNFARGIDMPEAVRLYPHIVRGEGQFVALLKKHEENFCEANKTLKLKQDKKSNEILKNFIDFDKNTYEYNKKSYIVKDLSMIKTDVRYVSIGVEAGVLKGDRFEPAHNLFTSFGKDCLQKIDLDYRDKKVLSYLKGEELECTLPDGYGCVLVNGISLGGFKISAGKFKNHYPKGLRNYKY